MSRKRDGRVTLLGKVAGRTREGSEGGTAKGDSELITLVRGEKVRSRSEKRLKHETKTRGESVRDCS